MVYCGLRGKSWGHRAQERQHGVTPHLSPSRTRGRAQNRAAGFCSSEPPRRAAGQRAGRGTHLHGAVTPLLPRGSFPGRAGPLLRLRARQASDDNCSSHQRHWCSEARLGDTCGQLPQHKATRASRALRVPPHHPRNERRVRSSRPEDYCQRQIKACANLSEEKRLAHFCKVLCPMANPWPPVHLLTCPYSLALPLNHVTGGFGLTCVAPEGKEEKELRGTGGNRWLP